MFARYSIEVEALQADVRFSFRRAAREPKCSDSNVGVKSNVAMNTLFTSAEELEGLEDLHMFRATRISPDLFQYVYNSQFCVTIPCQNFVPIVTQVNITRMKDSRLRYKDRFPTLSNFWLETAKQQIIEGEDLALRQVMILLSC